MSARFSDVPSKRSCQVHANFSAFFCLVSPLSFLPSFIQLSFFSILTSKWMNKMLSSGIGSVPNIHNLQICFGLMVFPPHLLIVHCKRLKRNKSKKENRTRKQEKGSQIQRTRTIISPQSFFRGRGEKILLSIRAVNFSDFQPKYE